MVADRSYKIRKEDGVSYNDVISGSYQTKKSMVTVFEHIESNESGDNDSDTDYLHGNSEMDESSFDMRDFNFHVDQEDESSSKQLAVLDDMDEMNNEEFDSGNDGSDNLGSVRKRNIDSYKKDFQSDGGFYLGQQFATKKDVKEFLRRYTIETRRVLKTIKDDSERARVICVGHVPGGDQEESCSFVLLVSKDKVTETWMVKTLNTRHKCVQSRCLTAMTSTFLSQELMEQIEENPNIPVKAVQEQFSKKFELSISKHQAFRARAKAQKQLHGDYTLQYGLLGEYCNELIRRNPGTTIHIEVEPPTNNDSTTRKFMRIYICFGSLKEGFKSIGRDLLGLDGAFMKGPYPGQILSAVGVDPNNGIYLLAFAIVEAENLSSWTWFVKCVGDDLDLASNSNFTFISDRQKGVLQAITKLYPSAEHRFCLRHIHENMKVAGYRGKAFKDMLWKIATQPTVVQFEREMETLKQMNVDAHLWLSKINPKHWARSHFSGRCHSDILLNNMCEVFNAKILEGRDKPIITALEYIREYLMRRIVNVLNVIDKSDGHLTPHASRLFEMTKKDASRYVVSWNGGDEYQVSGPSGFKCVVNVARKTCSCRRWEVSGIPCKHAIATNWNMAAFGQKVDIPEKWVHQVYLLQTWKKVYNFKLYPINGPSLWVKTKVPATITPPTHHKQVGRPKKKRNRSVIEKEEVSKNGKLSKRNCTVTCGKCKQKGHNSRSCKGQRYDGPDRTANK